MKESSIEEKKEGSMSKVETQKLELKQLPSNLRNAFLGEDNTLPIIISSDLTDLGEAFFQYIPP